MEKQMYLDQVLGSVTRPARYTGGEWNSIIKDWDSARLRIAVAYPDLYEIGTSNLALPILYDLLNRQPDVLAERVFAPWGDMAAAIRQAGIPLYSLESKHPLRDFDVLGFSLGYDLTFTNVLNMLHLAGIPVLSRERDDSSPLVIAGGSCALNPEPMADFIDLFVMGEAEEVVLELLEVFREGKGKSSPSHLGARQELLRQAARLPGVYVPAFYEAHYERDGAFSRLVPLVSEGKPQVQRRLVPVLPSPVTRPVVPFLETVHDRAAVEIQRGCSRGCRFCQAGIIYRPVRERSQEEVLGAVDQILSNCGYNEVSLVSLSTSDYSRIGELVAALSSRYAGQHLTISLPSLRIDSFSVQLMEALSGTRRVTLTFAPEAGSERLRRAINKTIGQLDILGTLEQAFQRGWGNIKLYFMLGLPGEEEEDIEAIADLVKGIYRVGTKAKGRQPRIRVSLSPFVPKPHTPFQWVAQESMEAIESKYDLLRKALRRTGTGLSWHDPRVSLLEGAISRGDRRIGGVIERAWRMGCVFDAWREAFDFGKWLEAFEAKGLSPYSYTSRQRALDEPLPWDHVDVGVSKTFLQKEYRKALESRETPDCCRGPCSACGLEQWEAACGKASPSFIR